jgi:hypothetical protein
LGYTYIDPDSAYIDVYALKYLNFIDQRYIGWNGYANNVPANQRDTVVYVTSKDYTDKMYFSLEQMPGGSGVINLETTSGAKVKYQNVYNKYVGKKETWLNKTDLYFEEYGYKGSYAFPLIRQAYRLLLKDYYKYSPTIDGNYVTVGQQNNYIMADKMYAMNPYVENSGRVEGMFGVPYFYFRNVYFPEADPTLDATYFSLIQRVDLTDAEMQKNVKKYLKSMLALGEEAASRIVDMMHHKGIFAAFVEDYTAKLKLGVRGDNQITPSTFTLERDDDPIYRRFHVNDLLEKTKKDDPFTLEFHTVMDDKLNNLFENSGADTRTGGGWEFNLIDRFKPGLGLKKDSLGKVISFLGFKDIINFPRETNADGYPSESSNIGSLNGAEYPVKTNYAFYLDTAYINRGTGWIKPQYLIAVDTLKVGVKTFIQIEQPPAECPTCDNRPLPPFPPAAQPPYLLARYLYNASMYAKEIDTDPDIISKNYPEGWLAKDNPYDYSLPVKAGIIHGKFGKSDVDGNAYVYDSKWDRFAFAWAIHKGDTLIVLKTTDPLVQDIVKGDPALINDKLIAQYGKEYNGVKYIDFGALRATSGKEIPEGKTFGVHALIYLGNNKHKDWVFSFRYVERGSDDFIIESETKDRNWNGTEIRPGYGGWLKWVGGVPVITRSDVVTTDEPVQASLMNVIEVKGSTAVAPVINEKVTEVSSVTVSGGKGNVTILNAGGKKIVISNILGQTIAKTVLSSDNASIAVPSGVVVVAIEGEKAVKAVVK